MGVLTHFEASEASDNVIVTHSVDRGFFRLPSLLFFPTLTALLSYKPLKPWYLVLLWVSGICLMQAEARAAENSGGEGYYQRLSLSSPDTLDPYGPLSYRKDSGTTTIWALSPLFSYTLDKDVDFEEFDFVYPVISYDRFGSEYRFHIFQLFSLSGGKTQSETNVHRFTLFPIYFQQRSPIQELNYTALLPIYGTLKNRLFRDEVHFVMLPLYVQSRKRDVVTDNYVYPFFHVRHGNGLKGWQLWPVVGHEHKEITINTNEWGDKVVVGGHDRSFLLWPFYLNTTNGIGTDNPSRQYGIIPLYSVYRSPKRDSTTYPWPFGYTKTVDREKNYTEIGAPWPFIVFAHGTGKTTRRVFPFFSESSNGTLESDWYLWPVYKRNHLKADPLERDRTRILFYLYSDTSEKNIETGKSRTRRDLWPFFNSYRDFNGDAHFQILSILEPFVPNNKSIERNYSPAYALWRTDDTARTHTHSQSLLWNLYRRESGPDHKKLSLLFGLFQYQSGPDGGQMRLFYIPVGRSKGPSAQTAKN